MTRQRLLLGTTRVGVITLLGNYQEWWINLEFTGLIIVLEKVYITGPDIFSAHS